MTLHTCPEFKASAKVAGPGLDVGLGFPLMNESMLAMLVFGLIGVTLLSTFLLFSASAGLNAGHAGLDSGSFSES